MLVPPGSSIGASCQLGLQRVQTLAPLPAQVREPALDPVESFAIEGVEPAGAFGAHVGEAALPEHAQLTRDGGLREPELRPDDVYDVAGAALAGGQQLKDSPPDGIAEDVEGLHNHPLYQLSRIYAMPHGSPCACGTIRSMDGFDLPANLADAARDHPEREIREWLLIRAHRRQPRLTRGGCVN